MESPQTGFEDKREKSSPALRLNRAINRLRTMSLRGPETYGDMWEGYIKDKAIVLSLLGTNTISFLQHKLSPNPMPEASVANIEIAKSEKMQGILNSPHNKDIAFRRGTVFKKGINHQSEDNFPESDKSQLQPVVTALVSDSLKFFSKSQYPDFKPKVNKKTKERKIELGKLKRYDNDRQAVRLVFKSGDTFKFANLDEKTYRLLEAGNFDANNPFLLTEILDGKINDESIQNLKDHGVKLHDLDDWYDIEACKVAIGVFGKNEAKNHPLNNLHITDSRFGAIFAVQYKNSEEEKQLRPIAITDSIGHAQAAAMPINRFFKEALSKVCSFDKNIGDKTTDIHFDTETQALPMHDDLLEKISPKLAHDMESLYSQSFANPGMESIAKLLNIREIRSCVTVTRNFAKIASLNRRLHQYIAGFNHPFIKPDNQLGNTDYHLKSMAENFSTAYLAVQPAVQPDGVSNEINNALAIAVHGNGNNDVIRKITSLITNHLNTDEDHVDPISLATQLQSAIHSGSPIEKFFAYQRIIRDEIFAAKRGESTAGVLAVATPLGTRELLETASSKIIGSSMEQLLANKMLSSTGRDEEFLDSIAVTRFVSSNSRTAVYSYASNGNEIRVRVKPDDPILLTEVLDKYANVDLLTKIRNTILKTDKYADFPRQIKELSQEEASVALWLTDKIDYLIFNNKDEPKFKRIAEENLRMALLSKVGASGKIGSEHAQISLDEETQYTSFDEMKSSATTNADTHYKMIRFTNIFSENVGKLFSETNGRAIDEKSIAQIKELYKYATDLQTIVDVVEGVELAYGLNKFYISEAVKVSYQSQGIDTSNTPVNLEHIKILDNHLQGLQELRKKVDIDSFDTINELINLGMYLGINADLLVNYISQKSDAKSGASLYQYLNVWLDKDGGTIATIKRGLEEISSR